MAGSKPATTRILMLSAPGQYHTPGVAWTYGWLVPGGMGGGASSAIARALGAGRPDRADALVCHAFILALALAALFSTTMMLGAPFLFRWMGGQGGVLSAALSYSNAVFSGAVSVVPGRDTSA